MPRRSICLLALLLVPHLANAGPIEWSYMGRVRTATGTGVMNLGTHALWYDPSGNGTVEPVLKNYVITAPLPEMTFSGVSSQLPGAPTNQFRPFSAGYGFKVTEAPVETPMDDTFLFSFTLADVASGQHTTIEYTGRVGVSAGPEVTNSVLFSLSLSPEERSFVLGNNRYTVRALGGLPDEPEEPAGAWLEVTATANTPEPGTIGLVGAGLVRLRRRHTC